MGRLLWQQRIKNSQFLQNFCRKEYVITDFNILTLCCCCCLWLFASLWIAACQASPSSAISQSLLKFMSTELVMLSNHLILCLSLHLLPSVFHSIKVFSSELAVHIRWPQYWSFSFSSNPSSEYSGLISLGIDWFDLFAVHGTLSSLFQHHSSKASILQRSAFFYGPTITFVHDHWKNHNIDYIWAFAGKVMSLVFNMLSRFVVAFLLRSKCLTFIAATSHSDFGAQEKKICHCFHFFPFYLLWSDGNRCHDISFF